MTMVNLIMDGRPIEAEIGTSVLEAARKAEIHIPTLCHHPLVEPGAHCRVCLVEVQVAGQTRVVTACNFPVSEDLAVATDTERVRRNRRLVIESLVERSGGVGALADLAGEYRVEVPPPRADQDPCILCGLCVQVCREVVGAGVLGFVGRSGNRRVAPAFDEPSARCIACGACATVCPTGAIRVVEEQGPGAREMPLGPQTPVYIPFLQAVPHHPVVDRGSCIHFKTGACRVCERVCETGAIDFEQRARMVEYDVGAVILATGFEQYDPARLPEYGYGIYDNVLTGLEFERMNSASGPTGGRILLRNGEVPRSIGIIHCAGSRDERHNRYCSRICCMYSLKFAHLAHEKHGAEVYNFYIDMRCFGKGFEEFYDRLLEAGVRFVRGRPATVTDFPLSPAEEGRLIIQVEDTLLDEVRRIPVDMVVLAMSAEPAADAGDVARTFGILRDKEGFFMEQHPKLAPVSTPTAGIYIAGGCQGPKDITDTVAQASAAAAQVLSLMDRGELEVEAATCWVIPEKCAGCRICNALCPMTAISYDPDKEVSLINELLCKGCGTCAAACPSAAIGARHFTDEQVFAEIEGILHDIRA